VHPPAVQHGPACLDCSVLSQSVVALITTDVHQRDVVSELSVHRASGVDDFSWQRQLRFEYDLDSDSVIVRQLYAR
jgi:hypothetical protein